MQTISLYDILENENASDEMGDENAVDDTNTDAETEENVANEINVNVEVTTVNNTTDSGSVEYQEAPSASAVPVPTFTPQQPHTVPAPGIAAHSAPQNLNTLPQGKDLYVILVFASRNDFSSKLKINRFFK